MITAPAGSYTGHRFPTAIIAPAIRLYFRCTLSYRYGEERRTAREIAVSYARIRRWCRQLDHVYAAHDIRGG